MDTQVQSALVAAGAALLGALVGGGVNILVAIVAAVAGHFKVQATAEAQRKSERHTVLFDRETRAMEDAKARLDRLSTDVMTLGGDLLYGTSKWSQRQGEQGPAPRLSFYLPPAFAQPILAADSVMQESLFELVRVWQPERPVGEESQKAVRAAVNRAVSAWSDAQAAFKQYGLALHVEADRPYTHSHALGVAASDPNAPRKG
ncbi:MAG: hypothetical protein VYE22_41080 [Myxococcota bacterium]|nr:hypothetical protein [Myxococcota bacterium]